MLPLRVEDLLPLEEYARRRKEFFDSHRRYVDHYRRVRVGPKLTIIFENRQTLWYRVQEVARIARLADARELQLELNLYNRLLPSQNRLQAALLIEIVDQSRLGEELAPWRELAGDHLRLHVAARSWPAHLVTCRPEDRAIGTAHWVQFELQKSDQAALADFTRPAWFSFEGPHYSHSSAKLSEDLRRSLLEDLEQPTPEVERVAG